MPTARYDLLDNDGDRIGSEDLRCAPGPMGWRSFSTIVRGETVTRADISVDASWHPVRVRIENDDHHLILVRRSGSFQAQRDDEVSDLGPATVILFPAPAFLVAAHRASADGAERSAIAIDLDTLMPTTTTTAIETADEAEEVATSVGTFTARRSTIGGRDFWVAGDILVSGPGVELVGYDKGGQGPVPH